MKETSFIQQNKEKWQDLESLLKEKRKDPDQLSELFIQVSEDLSYARTFYPNRSIRVYLNNITQLIFFNVFKNKRTRWKDIVFFWTEELPYVVYHSRKELLISVFVFLLSLFFGLLSSMKDPGFVQHIMGQEYLEMTKENIAKGDPLAVYKSANQMDMFLGITLNNLRVAFLTYITGLFFSIGSISILMYNGIMVATFQYFFYTQGLFLESFLTIWLHGTIEISCIVLAGGAGIRLGSGLLFPGTYTRLQALRISGTNSLKLLSGLAPLICLAGFIESFVTRYTATPDWLKASLILVSFAFIVGYFVVLPFYKSRRGFHPSLKPERLKSSAPMSFDTHKIYGNDFLFKLTFYLVKKHFKKIIIPFTVLSLLYSVSVTFTLNSRGIVLAKDWLFLRQLFSFYTPSSVKYANILLFSFVTIITLERFINFLKKEKESYLQPKEYFSMLLWCGIPLALTFSLSFISSALFGWTIVLMMPFITLLTFTGFYENKGIVSGIGQALKLVGSSFFSLYGLYSIVLICSLMLFFVLFVPVWALYSHFLSWQLQFTQETSRFIQTFIPCFLLMISLCFIVFFILNAVFAKYFSLKEQTEAHYLMEKIKKF